MRTADIVHAEPVQQAMRRARQRLTERQDLEELVAAGLKLGERVSLERRCYIDASFAWAITLEDDVRLSSDCTILAHSAVAKPDTGYAEVRPVIMRRGSQTGVGVTLLAGADVGERSMIAAGAVVTGTIPPGVIAGGVPAKPIGRIDDYVERFREGMRRHPVLDREPRALTPAERREAQALLAEHGVLYMR